MISKTSEEQEHNINEMGKPNILFYDCRLQRLGLGSVSVAQLNICTTLAKTFFWLFLFVDLILRKAKSPSGPLNIQAIQEPKALRVGRDLFRPVTE